MSLSELFKAEYLDLNYGQLLQVAAECNVSVTEDEARCVEMETRAQANSRLWFRMRTGRITASRFKSACRTNPALPSLSLIISICHPEMTRFKSSATSWGCEHEKVAISKYLNVNLRMHQTFKVTECGLFISTSYPFMGASPDGLVQCICCGEGICEVKVVAILAITYFLKFVTYFM